RTCGQNVGVPDEHITQDDTPNRPSRSCGFRPVLVTAPLGPDRTLLVLLIRVEQVVRVLLLKRSGRPLGVVSARVVEDGPDRPSDPFTSGLRDVLSGQRAQIVRPHPLRAAGTTPPITVREFSSSGPTRLGWP